VAPWEAKKDLAKVPRTLEVCLDPQCFSHMGFWGKNVSENAPKEVVAGGEGLSVKQTCRRGHEKGEGKSVGPAREEEIAEGGRGRKPSFPETIGLNQPERRAEGLEHGKVDE